MKRRDNQEKIKCTVCNTTKRVRNVEAYTGYVCRTCTIRTPEYTNTQWIEDANCAGMSDEIFYDEKMIKERYYKTICDPCTVVQDCLTYALKNNETYGVWGNMTPAQRHTLHLRKGKNK